MKTTRRFAVVTPVLNGAKFINGALASIKSQTYPNWVHIIVDGGSTDGTVEIVRAAMQHDSRLRLLEGKDRGMYDALFRGYEATAADGSADDICCWVPADDRLMPWAMGTMARAFDDGNEQWLSAMPGRWDADGNLVLVTPYAWFPQVLLRRGLFHGKALGWVQQVSVFFSRDLLNRLPLESVERIRSSKLAGDFILWCEFAKLAPLRLVPTVVAAFYVHSDNLSVTQKERYFSELRKNGAIMPPDWLGNLMRAGFRIIAMVAVAARARREARRLAMRDRNQGL